MTNANNIFQGKRVRLRGVEPGDWETHFKWNEDTESARTGYEIWFPTSSQSVRAWAEKESQQTGEGEKFRFQIENLDGDLVGTINTHTCDLRCGTFRYGLAILSEHQRKGYASEAIQLVLRYYFEERRYQKVNAEVFSFNEPSIRLHERLGFTVEGRLRRMIYSAGTYHDIIVYGMTKDEFTATRPAL